MGPEEWATQLCASPTGCVFLLIVEENGIRPEVAADSAIAVQIAAAAVGETTWYNGASGWTEAAALAAGKYLAPLAAAICAQPAVREWFAPVDLAAQQWIIGPRWGLPARRGEATFDQKRPWKWPR